MSKPQPILSNMPRHIKQKIVDSANTLTKFNIRLCSKEYNKFVTNSVISYKRLYCVFDPCGTSVHLVLNIDDDNLHSIRFCESPQGYLLKRHKPKVEKIVENGCYIDGAVKQFVKLMKQNNVLLKHLQIQFMRPIERVQEERFEQKKETVLEKIRETLASRRHPLLVNQFQIYFNNNPEDILRILPYLKPGTLNKICISVQLSMQLPLRPTEITLDGIHVTEQWKQADALRLSWSYLTLPIREWAHFNDIIFCIIELSSGNVRQIYQCFLGNQTFRSCIIYSQNINHRSLLEYFLQFDPEIQQNKNSYTSPHKQEESSIYLKIAIPEKHNDYFKVVIQKECLRVFKFLNDIDPCAVENAEERALEMGVYGMTEEFVELEAAELMADVAKYIF